MSPWWQARSRREQWLVAIMALCLAASLGWFGLIAPLRSAAEAARLRHERAAAEYAQVSKNLAAIAALGAPPPAGARLALEAAVTNTAAAAGVTLARLEADPAGGLRVAVPSAAPTVLFPWLALLQREHGVVATHLAVVKNDTGGLTLDATFEQVES